ncbi:hypothetical protein C2845_PM12G10220 [Panicum miliaceum]|uniref:HIG1 domain-containing protein n=1 Tax=Panicum miliaceum TaxID=4540 RepID=A0A3L6QMI0_PANMI|nr:hypothetical protein C2845_PM12G10220 [Panicum miliaceum]
MDCDRERVKPVTTNPPSWLHAQALTLAALAGSALVEYYDHQQGSGPKVHHYAKQFLSCDGSSQKE